MKTSELTGDKELRRDTVGHVRILAVWPAFLGDFTDEASKAEGFKDAGELFQWWREHRDGVEAPASTERPTVEIPVWTAAIEPVKRDRFLAPGAVDPRHVPADERGYLNSPERAADKLAVVPDDWQNMVVMQGRSNWAERQREERMEETARRDAKRLATNVKLAAVDLAREGIDPTPFLAAIERRFEELVEQQREAA
jgi:hypothetical protein